MSRKFVNILGLLGGVLLFAQVYTWSMQQGEKNDSVQSIGQTAANEITTTSRLHQERIKQQFDDLKLLHTAEQTILREQLSTLQQALQSHIDKSETPLYLASRNVDSDSDVFSETYSETNTLQELDAKIAQSDYQQQELIISQLDLEEVDPEWSGWAEAGLRASLESNVSLNARLSNLVCYTTFCRVEGEFGDSASQGELISELMALVPWEAQAFFQGDIEESSTGSLYILKEGVTEYPNG
jgi:hypothetical protein